MAGKRRGSTGGLRHGEPLLAGTFRRLGLVREARRWRVLAAWSEMVGAAISRDARAEQLRGTVLYVRASSSAYAADLNFVKAELLAKLRAYPCAADLTDLRFTVGPLDEIPAWWERSPRPAVAQRRKGTPAQAKSAQSADPALREASAEALAAVQDPELRASLGSLLARAGVAAPVATVPQTTPPRAR